MPDRIKALKKGEIFIIFILYPGKSELDLKGSSKVVVQDLTPTDVSVNDQVANLTTDVPRWKDVRVRNPENVWISVNAPVQSVQPAPMALANNLLVVDLPNL